MARYWMPVLLLPVLLVAWAFATVHRRGMERRKPGAKVAAPILLLIVLFATGLQSFAFARLYSDPECDTRTRAGEWIAQNIPAGFVDRRAFRTVAVRASAAELAEVQDHHSANPAITYQLNGSGGVTSS